MVTECSLLPHTALCYHTLQKVINNRSMRYTKAAFQAPGSGDLTNSPASPCVDGGRFQNTMSALWPLISLSPPTQQSSTLCGTVLFAEMPFAFTLMRVRETQAGLVPSVMKSDCRVLQAKGCKTFLRELKKPRENYLIWVYT